MIGTIPNPKKEICVNYSQNEVKEILSKISSYLVSNGHNYKQHAYDEFLGQITLHVFEFLSLGAYVVINVNYIDEKSTKISIEIQRAMGAFDEWHEVSKANRHLENVTKAISYLLQNPNYEVDTQVSTSTPNVGEVSNNGAFIIFAVGIIFYLIVHSLIK